MANQIVTLYRMNDNIVTWDFMEDSLGNFINNATVTMTLNDADGDAVTGVENLPMAYVTGSNGRYQGAISSNIGLTVGAAYTLEITAYSGDADGYRTLTVQVLDRTT